MRYLPVSSITLGLLLWIAPRVEADERWVPVRSYGFEDQPAGTAPADFAYFRSASGKPGSWLVQARGDAPSGKHVLVQSDADRSADRFLMAIADQPPLRDVRVAVRCRMLEGRIDQACGLVFRYQDAQNYYVTRANALEGNVRLYHVRNGRRTQIASWEGPISADAWHELVAEARADRIRVLFDGKPVLKESDETFASAGAVGLWVKADSVTAFDELRIESPAGL
jgi:hypothetical protein